MEKVLRACLIFGCVYFLLEAILYLSNARLIDVTTAWSESAKVYARLINQVLGSFELLIAILCFELQRNVKKYARLVKISAFWALIHATVLMIVAINHNFTAIFATLPSLYVWAPFYNQYVFFEAGLLLFYSLMVILWSRQSD